MIFSSVSDVRLARWVRTENWTLEAVSESERSSFNTDLEMIHF